MLYFEMKLRANFETVSVYSEKKRHTVPIHFENKVIRRILQCILVTQFALCFFFLSWQLNILWFEVTLRKSCFEMGRKKFQFRTMGIPFSCLIFIMNITYIRNLRKFRYGKMIYAIKSWDNHYELYWLKSLFELYFVLAGFIGT